MHNHQKITIDYKNKEQIVLVGNPNVGKSVIFNCLTGRYVTVSNYPGTTVDFSKGIMVHQKKEYVVIDTPGTSTLVPKSEDEQVTRNVLLKEEPKVIVQVADAKNLRRSLLLALQLLQMNFPLVLDLNMSDEAKERGFKIDIDKLAQILNINIVETVAITKAGIGDLKENIFNAKESRFIMQYTSYLERILEKVENNLPAQTKNKRLLAFLFLSEDENMLDLLPQDLVVNLQKIVQEIQKDFTKPIGVLILEEMQKKVEEIIKDCVSQRKILHKSIQEKISNFALRPLTGIPVMAGIIYLMYKFVGQFAAGTVVDFLEETLFGKWLLPALSILVKNIFPWIWLQDLLIGQYGLFSMAITYAFAIIFPIVTAFFIFFGLLEDSGYLPRLSVLSDRVFKIIGLNGKAILPMVLGLGCGTMAVLTTRILDTRKERLLVALLLALGVPCSAQLGVVLGMLGGLSGKILMVWLICIVTSLILVGLISDKVIPGHCSLFIQEIPPIRVPKISNILIKTWARLKWYLREAVPLFMIGTFILFILDKIKVLNILEKLGAPIVENLLGLPGKAMEAFLVGFLRRDYGAAGLYIMQKNGLLSEQQVLVSMVVITLFVPCIAQTLVTFKEYGWKKATAILIFVLGYAIFSGTILNYILKLG